jgi:hypothetical protein
MTRRKAELLREAGNRSGRENRLGLDLKRAMSEGKVEGGDDVKLNIAAIHRARGSSETGQGRQCHRQRGNHEEPQSVGRAKVGQGEVVQAVASAFIESKVKDPAQREA